MIEWKRGKSKKGATATRMVWRSRCGVYQISRSTWLPYLAKYHSRLTDFSAYANDRPIVHAWHKGSQAPWSKKYPTRKAAEKICEKHLSGKRAGYSKNKQGRRKLVWK